jgi:SAM-dependent methyltransferase
MVERLGFRARSKSRRLFRAGPKGESENVTDQVYDWAGETGARWVEEQDRHDRRLAPLTPHLMRAADIGPADHVLDVGCGCGYTSRLAAAAASSGQVVGFDVSPVMLEAARARSTEENLRFQQGDAQTFAFAEGGFDVVMSRFGVMFFEDATAAFANLARALRPGGRLAFLCWQRRSASPHMAVPFGALAAFGEAPDLDAPAGACSLADADGTREMLGRAGFTDIRVEPVHEAIWIGDDMADSMEYYLDHSIGRSILAGAGQTTVEAAKKALADALRPYQTAGEVRMEAAAWQVTARR